MKNLIFALLLCLTGGSILGQSIEDALHDNQNAPLICGHRGGFYTDFPENSLSAFDCTVSKSAPSPVIVEFDPRRSKDGTLFLMHDEQVDRTTNGHGKISELSDSYLKSLFLKKADGQLTDQKIPTFDALLDYAKTRKSMYLMLDIKEDIWSVVVDKLGQAKLAPRSIILTFTPADSKKVAQLSKDAKISCLIKNETDWEAIEKQSIRNDQLVAYVNKNTDRKLIERLRKLQVRIMADVSENTRYGASPMPREFYAQIIQDQQLDILITDYPVEALRSLGSSGKP